MARPAARLADPAQQAGLDHDVLEPGADGLLDVTAAAVRLGTPVRFVRRLVAERRIPFYKVGRYVRFSREDLDRWIEDCRVTSHDAQIRHR
jgi:excisionase family DNA binding protein